MAFKPIAGLLQGKLVAGAGKRLPQAGQTDGVIDILVCQAVFLNGELQALGLVQVEQFNELFRLQVFFTAAEMGQAKSYLLRVKTRRGVLVVGTRCGLAAVGKEVVISAEAKAAQGLKRCQQGALSF